LKIRFSVVLVIYVPKVVIISLSLPKLGVEACKTLNVVHNDLRNLSKQY